MTKESIFKTSLIAIALIFMVIFCLVVIPPLIKNPDIIGAFGAGFVNPYASGYSSDVICCWVILLVWVLYEYPKVKHAWVCVILGLVPGVAVGLALYLFLRIKPMKDSSPS